MIDAHRAQHDSESGMFRVAENDHTSLVKDIRIMRKSMEELNQYDGSTGGESDGRVDIS